jgi:hypothetical protein
MSARRLIYTQAFHQIALPWRRTIVINLLVGASSAKNRCPRWILIKLRRLTFAEYDLDSW